MRLAEYRGNQARELAHLIRVGWPPVQASCGGLDVIDAQGDGAAGAVAGVLRRPQDPAPPFPYESREVKVADKGAV